ncbi:hypothetical protein M0R45_021640 [Rubus argutus]|uniref:Uncharacterized protein n=1 Tax=Rubus argutus TaxID=59490 RepID=A0AAW1XEF7_RUBAR
MMKPSLAIMFVLFSIVLVANMGQMESVEASRNGMPLIVSNKVPLSQAADPNSIVLPCPSQCPHNQTHPACCECDPTKGSCKTCCKLASAEGPLIVGNQRPLFPVADQNSIVLPCPSQCPNNQTHPACCECDPTKGSCNRCCKISLN